MRKSKSKILSPHPMSCIHWDNYVLNHSTVTFANSVAVPPRDILCQSRSSHKLFYSTVHCMPIAKQNLGSAAVGTAKNYRTPEAAIRG